MREGLSVFSSPPEQQANGGSGMGHGPHYFNARQQQEGMPGLFPEEGMPGSVPREGEARPFSRGGTPDEGIGDSVPLKEGMPGFFPEEGMAISVPREGGARSFSREGMAGATLQAGMASSFSQEGMGGSVPLQGGVAGSFSQEGMAGSIPQGMVQGSYSREGSQGCFPREGMAGSYPVASCSRGVDELETSAADTLETSAETCSSGYQPPPAQQQADRSDWSATPSPSPSPSVPQPRPRWESEKTPDTDVVPAGNKNGGMVHGKGGLLEDGFGDVPDIGLVSRGLSDIDGLPYATTGDSGIAAPDWLDVTTAMLSAIDDADPVSV